jgi:hypothetical protein
MEEVYLWLGTLRNKESGLESLKAPVGAVETLALITITPMNAVKDTTNA